MSEQEGVIKYRLDHHFSDLAANIDIREINAWRCLLFRLKLIGQLPEKYGGLGFGNISCRLLAEAPRFLITGTQTGHIPMLKASDFAVVETVSPLLNSISSSGPAQPSSEALTHASVYLHQPDAMAVIHVHCPELWRNTQKLRLSYINADIDYGSVEMAEAVEQLLSMGELQTLPLFSMLGHEDGIVAFGSSMASAANTLLTQLASAIAIEQLLGDN